MKYFKFTRKKSAGLIPRYTDVYKPTKDGYLVGDIIFTKNDSFNVEGIDFIGSIDGFYYPIKDENKSYFEQTEVSDSIVVPETKSGIDVYNKPNGTKLGRLAVDEHVLLNLSFTTDSNGNVWASCCYQDKDGIWKDGSICYKNDRNNYANVLIPDFSYTTVLTESAVDHEKVELLRAKEVVSRRMMLRSAYNIVSDANKTQNTKTASKTQMGGVYKTSSGKKKTFSNEKNITAKVAKNAPSIVQNLNSFPPVDAKSKSGIYKYNYLLNYTGLDFSLFYKRENLDTNGIAQTLLKNENYYNRFKLAMPDDSLSKGFVHIFFTRPDLNFASDANGSFHAKIKNDPFMNYQISTKKGVIDNLYLHNGQNHYFNLFLSNKARSFSLTDENLDTIDYGKTYHNNSITLGKNTIKSLANGTFEINYHDNRDLDILALHKAWIKYISNVTIGKWNPKTKYIYRKIIDYACSIYVIVTAEDFETVIYWSKYYGVFPINVPYSALSWTSGDVLTKPEYSITYAYSWKEDFDPLNLTEMNLCAFRNKTPKSTHYVPSYNCDIGHSGATWVGAPFIELVKYPDKIASQTNQSNAVLKLRFQSKSSTEVITNSSKTKTK